MKKADQIQKISLRIDIVRVALDLSCESIKEVDTSISEVNHDTSTNYQKIILIISGNRCGVNRTKSFHFEIISAAQQMKKRNSAYQFFRLPKG